MVAGPSGTIPTDWGSSAMIAFQTDFLERKTLFFTAILDVLRFVGVTAIC